MLGLGDVYLGAPVATPLDPRHRLVTTKYNPARTWTPENAVGIGGAYLCVYGMEGPGGYQFVGRTRADVEPLPPDRRLHRRQAVAAALLRPDPLLSGERRGAARACGEDFPLGRYRLKIEETVFSLRDYNRFLHDNAASITAFKAQQQAAFEAERERWRSAGQAEYATDATVAEAAADSELDSAAQRPRGRDAGGRQRVEGSGANRRSRRAGRTAGHRRIDEDGDQRRCAVRGQSAADLLPRRRAGRRRAGPGRA